MLLATATAPGWRHTNPGEPGKKNNQDAIAVRTHPSGVVVVLCDGCGEQPYSATGSDLGANLLAQTIVHHLKVSKVVDLSWNNITIDVLGKLIASVSTFATDESLATLELTIAERFLFTAVILIVEDDTAVIVAFGDGVVMIDDETIVLEPPLKNAPPYLGYLLLSNTDYHNPELRHHLAFSVIRTVKLSELQKGIVLGTDGLVPLLGEELHHPALLQPKSLQRWLNALTFERIKGNVWMPGLCSDDVTLAILRTEAAQARLVEGRSGIAEAKQLLADLEHGIADLRRQIRTLARFKGIVAIHELEQQLTSLTSKAHAVGLDAAIVRCRSEIKQLRDLLPPMRLKPSASILEGIARAFLSPPIPPLPPKIIYLPPPPSDDPKRL